MNSLPTYPTFAAASAHEFTSCGLTGDADGNERDDDVWLGCESVHPLTWLPPSQTPRRDD
jgi:hypothetical protein